MSVPEHLRLQWLASSDFDTIATTWSNSPGATGSPPTIDGKLESDEGLEQDPTNKAHPKSIPSLIKRGTR
jgi:hypothetical protein